MVPLRASFRPCRSFWLPLRKTPHPGGGHHALEWSRAYTGRLQRDAAAVFAARAPELSRRLETECAQGSLPFLTMPYRERLERELPPLLPRVRARRHMLVLGIGGSALGARALQRAFAPGQDGPCHDGPCLWIADNVCSATFESWLAKLPPHETTVVCISKSGGTIETLAQYFLCRDWLRKALGERWHEHMIVVTDLHQGFLREEASRYALDSLEVPDNLGGRYSALSAVGLLPAAFLGIDWQALLDGAAAVARPLAQDPSCLAGHPAFHLACWANALESHGYSQLVFFCYVPQWATYGPWFAQLWAESLGKDGKGIMPVPATGVTDQHSVNQMFLDGQRDKGCIFVTSRGLEQGRHFGQDLPENWSWLRGKPFGALLEAEGLGTRMALCKSGVPLLHMEMGECTPRAAGSMMLLPMPTKLPEQWQYLKGHSFGDILDAETLATRATLAQKDVPVVHLDMPDESAFSAGKMMMLLEAATIFTGWLMGIDPLDQPAVELGKRLANTRLGASGYPREAADLAEFLAVAQEPESF
mgnify:CR=1 FL=1